MTLMTSNLNPDVYRVNKVLMYLCLIAGTGMILMGVGYVLSGGKLFGIGVVGLAVWALGLLHGVAASGARRGKRYGLNITRLMGVLLLVVFPISTLLGLYMLIKSGSAWTDA